GGDGVGDAAPRLEGLASRVLERDEHEETRQREADGSDDGEHALARDPMLVHPDEGPEDEERERDAGGGELRKRNAEEDHPAEHEVDADERADHSHEHAAEERIAEQEVRGKDLEQRRHPPVAPPPCAAFTIVRTLWSMKLM